MKFKKSKKIILGLITAAAVGVAPAMTAFAEDANTFDTVLAMNLTNGNESLAESTGTRTPQYTLYNSPKEMKAYLQSLQGYADSRGGLLDEKLDTSAQHNIKVPGAFKGNGIRGDELLAGAAPESNAEGPVIITQPESAAVSYPQGAQFRVEVENPDEVAAYQWIMTDIEGNVFVLEGESAKTDTLVIPSTSQSLNRLEFFCNVLGTNGQTTRSESAFLDIDNKEEDLSVFYIGDYAIEPGESIDLAATDVGNGFKLGSGKVSFAENGTDLTFENVKFNNSHVTSDYSIMPNVGLSLLVPHNDKPEYKLTFIGENEIYNAYYDANYNAGGIPFDMCFYGVGTTPVINFVGDGTLSVTNGTYAVRAIGDLNIDIDMDIKRDRIFYARGIVANNIKISEGHTLNLDVNGAAISADGNIYITGSKLNIDSNTPRVSVGISSSSVVEAGAAIFAENSDINISSLSSMDVCNSAAGVSGLDADGDLIIKNSNVYIDMKVMPGSDIYASWYYGTGAENTFIEDSKLDIKLDGEQLSMPMGLFSNANAEIINSEVNTGVRAVGTVYGVAVNGDLSAEDSSVNVEARNYPYDEEGFNETFGIACKNLALKITDPKWQVRGYAENGKAVVCRIGTAQSEPAEYTEGYKSTNVNLKDGTECILPAEYVINLSNVVQVDEYLPVETIYAAADKTTPVQEAVFSIIKKGDDNKKDDKNGGDVVPDGNENNNENSDGNNDGKNDMKPDENKGTDNNESNNDSGKYVSVARKTGSSSGAVSKTATAKTAPGTGDRNLTGMWTGVAIAAAATAAGVIAVRKKKV